MYEVHTTYVYRNNNIQVPTNGYSIILSTKINECDNLNFSNLCLSLLILSYNKFVIKYIENIEYLSMNYYEYIDNVSFEKTSNIKYLSTIRKILKYNKPANTNN